MNKILITPRSLTKDNHPALDALTRAGFELVFSKPGIQPNEDELIALLPGCVGYLAGVEKVNARVLESASDLRVISRNGAGVDNIDLVAAQRLGIIICRAEGANARGVAELAIGMMLSLARHIPPSSAAIKAGGWKRYSGVEIEGRTLGLLGCGKIGKTVAALASALGMKVLAHDVYPDPGFRPSEDFAYDSFENVLTHSDFISLHCPARQDGKPVLDKEAIRMLPKGAFVINTARASLVNDKEILEALHDNRIAGFATDVYEYEPPVLDELLLDDRVIATPHIGGLTDASVSRAVTVAVENLLVNLGQ